MVIQLVKPLPGATMADSHCLSPATRRVYDSISDFLWHEHSGGDFADPRLSA
jgi:hypothetical protein